MASPYDFMIDPSASAQAAALEKLMRQRKMMGLVGQLSGDRVLAPVGRQVGQDVDNEYQYGNKAAWQAIQEQALRNRAERDVSQTATANRSLALKERALEAKLRAPPKEPKPADPDPLRREFQNQQVYKDYQTVLSSYQKIKNTSDTGPGDISLIFAYMKLLDPGSTVREGEFATAANAGSVDQKVIGTYNRLLSGEKLPPEVRKQFRDEAGKVFEAQQRVFEGKAGKYREYAKKRGLDPADVVFEDAPAPASPPPVAPEGESVTVEWKGKRKTIPRARLEEAKALGAVEVP